MNRGITTLLAVTLEGDTWVLPCDEVSGILTYRAEDLGDLPVTVSMHPSSLAQGILRDDGREIACLSTESLAAALSAALP